jgi:hypothetical protein
MMSIPKDKWLHFGVALVISLFHPLIAVVLSVLKEIFDFIRYGWRTQGFWRMAVGDLIADGVVILIGGTLWILLTVS